MADNSVKRKNMADLAKFRDELHIHPRLKFLFLELTNQCNMQCLHCGSSCSPENLELLDINKIRDILEEVRDRYGKSSVMICLTGGEPLMHPGFKQIAEMIYKMGFSWGITTNGILIDEDMADFFKKNHLGSISISLDGLRENHDMLRQRLGAYDKVLKTVRILQGKGIAVQITTVVNHSNILDLDGLYNVLNNLKVSSWRLVNIEPIGRALNHSELMLKVNEYRELLDFIRQKRFDQEVAMEVTYGCSHYLPDEYEHMVRDNYFLCGAGIYVASILCNGDIFTCLDIQRSPDLVQGNIDTDDFCEVWEHGFQSFREDRAEKSTVCSICDENRFCAGDSAHTWNFDTNEPMLCLYQILQEDA